MTKTISSPTTKYKRESVSYLLDASIDDVFRKGSKTYLRLKQHRLTPQNFEKKINFKNV